MTENFVRHFIAFLGTLICLLAFLAGYGAGQLGWWFAGFVVIIMYIVIYRLLEV